MVDIAAASSLTHGGNTCRWCNRRRQRGRARAGHGLQRRPAQPGGLPELRTGGEHGGDAGRVVLLGPQGRGEEGGGLPLPGLPGQPGLRRYPQHDEGPAAAGRLQGQDASLQQVPPFYSGCDWWVSSPCSIFRGSLLRGVAATVDAFGSITITSWNWKRLHRPSSVPIFFRCSHLPGVTARLLRHRNCFRDSARVQCLLSLAHLFVRPSRHACLTQMRKHALLLPVPRCILLRVSS